MLTRISAAERLLRSTDYTVTEVAIKCGYNDSNYFASIFKQVKGISPKKYSMKHR
jgi:AraC-like DNA-binding protein